MATVSSVDGCGTVNGGAVTEAIVDELDVAGNAVDADGGALVVCVNASDPGATCESDGAPWLAEVPHVTSDNTDTAANARRQTPPRKDLRRADLLNTIRACGTTT